MRFAIRTENLTVCIYYILIIRNVKIYCILISNTCLTANREVREKALCAALPRREYGISTAIFWHKHWRRCRA